MRQRPVYASRVARERLGLVRTIVILWISGAVVQALLTSVVLPHRIAWTILGGSLRRGEVDRWEAVVFVAVTALLGAAGVCVGVRIVGFRVGYGVAAFALALGTTLTTALALATLTSTRGDATGIAAPAFGVLLFPLQLLLGLVLPAYLVDTGASPSARPVSPEPPYHPQARI
jgi:hypothetical protein